MSFGSGPCCFHTSVRVTSSCPTPKQETRPASHALSQNFLLAAFVPVISCAVPRRHGRTTRQPEDAPHGVWPRPAVLSSTDARVIAKNSRVGDDTTSGCRHHCDRRNTSSKWRLLDCQACRSSLLQMKCGQLATRDFIGLDILFLVFISTACSPFSLPCRKWKDCGKQEAAVVISAAHCTSVFTTYCSISSPSLECLRHAFKHLDILC